MMKNGETENGKARNYRTIPATLTYFDGRSVENAADFALRRREILNFYEKEVYGFFPKSGFSTSFALVESGEYFGAIRKQVKITVSTEKGEASALALFYFPKSRVPSPVLFGLNFGGNHTVTRDGAVLKSLCQSDKSSDEIEKTRGCGENSWCVLDAIPRGVAVGTINCGDFAEDGEEIYRRRIISLFDSDDFSAIGAWAFGISVAIDYLSVEQLIDKNKIAIFGHSRLGKACLYAGAMDERAALVISNDSGNSGAALSRANTGETIKAITSKFPYWFSRNYSKYADNENALPVDQHLLLAAIAPRKLYVACAADDLWADPQGSFNALCFALPAFRLFGQKTIESGFTMPPINQAEVSESTAFHIRSGGHDVTPSDIKYFLDYAVKYL